jgi:excinuclease UvrABC nuclease subunit
VFGKMDREALAELLEREMLAAARMMEFEKAASLRDKLEELRTVVAGSKTVGRPGRKATSRPGGSRGRKEKR